MSACVSDQASDNEAFFTDIAIQNSMKAVPMVPKTTGYCANCDEKLDPGHKFCDSDCRDDWDKRQQRRG